MASGSSALPSRIGFFEAFWRRVLLDPNARAAPFAVDVSRRPVETPIVQRRPVERRRIFALVAFSLIASLFLINAAYEALMVLGIIACFLLVLCAFMAWVIVAAGRMEWHASWLSDDVKVRDRRWSKEREWSAPYVEFNGVAVRKLHVSRRRGGVRRRVTYHLAELRHEDPLKTVLIASFTDAARTNEAARTASEALDLPLL